jgi:hypothetical protein
MIEDIKVEQRYGWVTVFNSDGSAERVWSATKYCILFLRNGEWHEVPVEHINPQPPTEQEWD